MSFWKADSVDQAAGTFSFNVTPVACVGPPERSFLMGGVAMAAAIDAAERATEKPLLWATIQFVSGGTLADELSLEVETLGGGRSVAQVGVSVAAGDRLLQRMAGALGRRDGHPERQFVQAPVVPPPQACPRKVDDTLASSGNLIDQFERRTALEDDARGIEYLWLRPTFAAKIDAALLGLVSDFMLGAHELSRGGTSLDNTLRLGRLVPTDWILCVTQLSVLTQGTAVGTVHQFSQDGTLLATSSQTGLLPRALSGR